MAKAKAKGGSVKKSSKPAKKSASSGKKSSGRAAKRAPTPLSTEEKQQLIKPADGYTELVERFAATWEQNKALKVSGVSPSTIARGLARAKKAAAREEDAKRALEQMQDARLKAEHEVWKLVLDVYAMAKAQARVTPEIGRAFAFLGDALTKRSRPKGARSEPAEGGAGADAAEVEGAEIGNG